MFACGVDVTVSFNFFSHVATIVDWLVGFVALRHCGTAVYLATLFPGQA